MTRFAALVERLLAMACAPALAAVAGLGALSIPAAAAKDESPAPLSTDAGNPDFTQEIRSVRQWRAERVAALTSETGWLTLVGLYWLDNGDNSFGRAPSNHLVLDHPGLAPEAGTFFVGDGRVRFRAVHGSGITYEGRPVSSIDLIADSRGEPTVLESGSLRFFLIERAGKLGVRVRDINSPRRRDFRSIEYYPIDPRWAFDARFEEYQPHHRLRIVNILGLEEELDCPGALVFERDGRQWRLDAVLESPGEQTLFVMFADRTNGDGSYGGGRFLHVPLPHEGRARVDFNESYNPPCAFNDFATCPLPPEQNRLALRVEAGEMAYGNGHGGG
jgi:uncharacterized protein (DUF1684 family)